MLSLTKNQIISHADKVIPNKKRIKTTKHFPNSTREWKNSIYLFNKNNLNVIPVTDLACMKLIKAYFTLFNKKLENKLRTRKFSVGFRRKSLNKVFISGGEYEHTNNKVTINLYLFNRQKSSYKIAIKRLKTKIFRKLKQKKKIFSERLSFLEKKSFKCLRIRKFRLLKQKKLFLIKNLNNKILNVKTSSYVNLCVSKFFTKLLKKEYNRTLQYFFYKQLLFINKSKFTYLFLQHLKQHLYKVYNKQIEFNLINLRRFYLNSDIMLESIIKKIDKNRKKVLISIKKLRDKVLVLKKTSFLHNHKYKKKLLKKNVLSKSHKQLIISIRKKLKYKDVTGFRLEARGRLTKRYTASRSVLKVSQKGNLLNRDSSLKGLSSVLLKGNLSSNLQYTKLVSKDRIGSYGLKGWVSSN